MSIAHRSLAWSFAQKYTDQVIAFVYIVIISRILTPKEIGIYSVCAVLIGFAAVLRDSGISQYVIQEKALTQKRIESCFGVLLASTGAMALIFGLAAHWIAQFYETPGIKQVIWILLIGFVLAPLATLIASRLRRDFDFSPLFWAGSISAMGALATAVTLAMLGYSYLSIAWGNVMGIVAMLTCLIALRPQYVVVRPALKEMRHVLDFGLPVLGTNLCLYADRYFAELIIGRTLGLAPVALFNRALATREIFNRLFYDAVVPVVLPSFSAQIRQSGAPKQAYLQWTSNVLAVAWPFFAIMGLMASPTIRLLFGDQWLPAAPLLSILCLAGMIWIVTALAPQMIMVLGKVRILFKVQIVMTAVRLGLVALAATHSLSAVAIVFVATNAAGLAIFTGLLHRFMDLRFRELGIAILRTIAVTVLTIAPVLMVVVSTKEPMSLMVFLATAAAAAIVWLIAISILKHQIFREIAAVFGWLAASKNRRSATRRH